MRIQENRVIMNLWRQIQRKTTRSTSKGLETRTIATGILVYIYMIHSKIQCRFGGQQYDVFNYPKATQNNLLLLKKSQ